MSKIRPSTQLNATGTPSATTYLRGDNSWATPPGGSSVLDWVSVKDHGAVGDGTTDDTAAIQAAINACPRGGVVYLPRGTYKLTAALSITTPLTLLGDGVVPVLTTISASGTANWNSINAPDASPWLDGTVLLQSTAATNGIEITGASLRVDLIGLGIRFADAIKFSNTGHGVYGMPPANGTGRDNGLWGARWSDVIVFGHDGNHYAYSITNGIYNEFERLQSYGGGALYLDNNSSLTGHYGNSVFTSFYAQVFDAGTAHGVHLHSTLASLNFITFLRCQVTTADLTVTYPASTAPGSSQKNLYVESPTDYVVILGGDFETNVGGTVTTSTNTYISPGSYLFGSPPASSTPGHTVADEGSALTQRPTLNFVGTGVTATDDSTNGRTVVTVPGLSVQTEGTALTQRTVLDFTGPGVTVTDDVANSRTVVNIPGELLMTNGVTNPPVPVTTEDGTDWLYEG